jgi:hypothetical protein
LCTAAGDKASLAIAMAGLVIDRAHQARIREASQLASEAWALIEPLGNPTCTGYGRHTGVHEQISATASRWP